MRDFVEDFAELGQHFYLPVRSYSSGMRARLAFGVSMAVPFDTYLVDEVSAVGDAAFRAKSNHVFNALMQAAGAVVVSHSMPTLRESCQTGAVLVHGQITCYHDLEDAITAHTANMRRPLASSWARHCDSRMSAAWRLWRRRIRRSTRRQGAVFPKAGS